jgi:hypothetical protein
LKLTDVSEVRTASIIRAMMMEAVRTSETLVNFNVTTRRYNPEDSKRHTRCRENLKSHKVIISLNSINQLIFVVVKCGVLFEVRTEFLNII